MMAPVGWYFAGAASHAFARWLLGKSKRGQRRARGVR